ncbi:MAG: phytanoyl-CoA dioxygenase family protein, partial [Gammaproteobacteria bacterium]
MTVHEGQELTETALLSFLHDGYLVLQPPELDAAFHAEAFEAAAALYRTARSERGPVHLTLLGDHLLAHVPSLYNMLNAPSVRAALTGILGPDYALHPHHFVHAAGAADQGFHQDGNLPWNTRGHFRSPRPVAAILFYYPQAVSDDMGPTEILPGTQYWRGAFESEDSWHADDALDRGFEAEVARHPDLAYRDVRLDQSLAVLGRGAVTRKRLSVPAGSVVILHYDLVHRGTRQGPGTPAARYMYKFSFLRTREPGPSLRWPSLQWPSQRHRIAGAERTHSRRRRRQRHR